MRWSEYWSLKDENAAFAARSASVPIIHRFLGKLSNWTTHNFKVQDGLMRKALDEVLHNYQDLDLQLTDYTFAPPFVRADPMNQYHDNAAPLTDIR